MWLKPDNTHIPIRKARANLAALCSGQHPIVILKQRCPIAILSPVPCRYQLTPGVRRRLRPELRTHFARLLLELLPEGS